MSNLINNFLKNPMTGKDIENLSFNTIEQYKPKNIFSNDEWEIVKRIIHASADFSILPNIIFNNMAIECGISALRKCNLIYTDANMIRSGININYLQNINSKYNIGHIRCYIADKDVAEQAKQTKLPRSLFAIRKAKNWLNGNIAIIGNSPIALMELNNFILTKNIKPSLVIGVPVGFVNVPESKKELIDIDIPSIVIKGNRGGSPLAVAIIHALAKLAVKTI